MTRKSKLAILVTARVTTAQYEWYMHRPLAERAGLSPAVATAIAERQLKSHRLRSTSHPSRRLIGPPESRRPNSAHPSARHE